MTEKITFLVNKDIADHPHFHIKFLKLVASFEDSKDVLCSNCTHSLFDHVKSGYNGYCRICHEERKECKTLKKYFQNKKGIVNVPTR